MPRPETCVKRKSVHKFFLFFIVHVIGFFLTDLLWKCHDRFVLIDRNYIIIKTGKGCHIGHNVIYIMFFYMRCYVHSDNFIVCIILNISLEQHIA